ASWASFKSLYSGYCCRNPARNNGVAFCLLAIATASNSALISLWLMNATAITNSAEPTIHKRKSPSRQFIVFNLPTCPTNRGPTQPMPLYWLCCRHSNQISVVIEPRASLIRASHLSKLADDHGPLLSLPTCV